jgi:hypothetical protein
MKEHTNIEFVPVKWEFLKWVILYVSILTALVLVNAFALMWYTKDLSSLSAISLGVIGWFSTIIGLYTWKAKHDHSIGYRQGYYKSGMSVDDVVKMTSINANGEEETQ